MDIVPAMLYVLLTALNVCAVRHQDRPVPEPLVAPCDPGFGFPRPRAGCPDPEPLVGLVTAYDDGMVTVQPIRVLVTGPEGEAYAEAHGLEYPFSNDYHQVPVGEQRRVRVQPGTVCTGSILVAPEDSLRDHLVDCPAFADALRFHGFPVPAALWFDGEKLVQLSELYRP